VGKELEKREKHAIVGENAQYALALGVIGVMLYVVGLPAFVIFLLGAFSFFLWKLFATGSASETRKVFEFYLAANEILRDSDRRWYGFEMQEAIARGEKILKTMHTAPPLIHYALGALYHKTGDYASALKNLEYVIEDDSSRESAIVFPSSDLREYVRILRKVEREPGDAPQTSAAIRSLERARKNRGRALLDDCRGRANAPEYHEIAEKSETDPGRFVFYQDEITDQKW
jgi:tetratricopeptide (TPR) repeat protein